MTEKQKNFAMRVQKHPFVREYLMKRDDGICHLCGKPILKNTQVFHATYDRECITDKVVKVSCPTRSREDASRYLPDCANCEVFYECVDGTLYPVHAMCNRKLAE